MKKGLLEISVEELLEKFGAGNHKPGSGSAAAYQGMIASKLIVTVINLTNEEKRKKYYISVLPNLLSMEKKVRETIFPELQRLFEEDSKQFDKTIKSRELRDNEEDPFKKTQLNKQALIELKVSIEIPIKIAKLCIELAEISQYVFDNGFQSARGDSQVAFSGSVAALGGCISIINLNLLSFNGDDISYTEEIFEIAKELKERHTELNLNSSLKIEILEQEYLQNTALYKEFNRIIVKARSKRNHSDQEIEKIAREIQNLVWENRKVIWKRNCPTEKIRSLKANMILKKVLGYEFQNDGIIGVNSDENDEFEIAGLIDQSNKLVLISNSFSKQTQNFTVAHELAHAVMHKQVVLHRDRPIDGSQNLKRNLTELQADKFASFFLMPKKAIKEKFEKRFLSKVLEPNEMTAFRLINNSNIDLKEKYKNRRGFSRAIASATNYNSNRFKSMAETFNVSVEAMAIRIEELGLIEF